MQARVAPAEVKELPQRNRLVGWLVVLLKDLRRFSDISAISRIRSRR